MKVLLLYPNKEFSGKAGYENRQDIIKDLNLEVIFRAASRELSSMEDTRSVGKEDSYIQEVMRKVMLTPLKTKEEVEYRQALVKDALEHSDIIENIYHLSEGACEDIKKHKESAKERQNKHSDSKGHIVTSYELLQHMVMQLQGLGNFLRETENVPKRFVLQDFYRRFSEEYSDEFMKLLTDTVRDMEVFIAGGTITYSAQLGPGMKQSKLVIHSLTKGEIQKKRKAEEMTGITSIKWYQKLFQTNTIQIRDEELLREEKSIENALFGHLMAYFDDFLKCVMDFFEQLHFQTGFYLGCIYLNARMKRFSLPHCFPEVNDTLELKFNFRHLYEVSMALLMQKYPVSNNLETEDKWLFVITGANQGGKSTYLRSIGIAQIMFQCGMFVAAQSFKSRLYDQLFLHFTRREDSTMSSGRLDEELKRMDGIIRKVTKDSLILLNESFATTTEKEGSQIASDMVQALYESGITICMVTHLLQFANELYAKHPEHAVFLSAERKDDGERTFRILEHSPAATSFGLDLYDKMIEGDA